MQFGGEVLTDVLFRFAQLCGQRLKAHLILQQRFRALLPLGQR